MKKVEGIFSGKGRYRQTESEKRYGTDLFLLKEYHHRLGEDNVTFEDAKFLFNEAIDCINYALLKKSYVNIRKHGIFHLAISKRSKVYSPRTGEFIKVPLRYKIKFRPSASFKALINGKVKKNLKNAYKHGEGI
jgi:nucleoid DNA-binding protein